MIVIIYKKRRTRIFNAKALYEYIKQQAEDIERKVLAENPFYITDDMFDLREKRGFDGDKRIYDPDEIYIMDLDNDFPKFLNLVYPEYVKAGIANHKGKEYCPDAEAKSLMYEAEKQLVEYGINIIPNEYAEQKETLRKAVGNIKYRYKVLEFVLMLESDEIETMQKYNEVIV